MGEYNYECKVVEVARVSIISNVLLSLVKLLAGIFANSAAMVSDAIHSTSDVISSIVVIIGVKVAAKESDKEHPYGHERFESVAAIILALILVITGLFIGYNAVVKLQSGTDDFKEPGILALLAAILSIIVKEAMYWYARRYAKLLKSEALMADAWHHRSDSLSSIGALIGVIGARAGYGWFDSVASIIICVFILKAAYDIFVDAINKLIDHSCSEELQQEIKNCAINHARTCGVDRILTREFGNKVYVELVVLVDGNITLTESDKIAKEIHDDIEKFLSEIKHVTVVMKPKQN